MVLTVLGGPQNEIAQLIEAGLQWVAYRIVERHDYEFLKRDSLLWLSHPLCCLLNPWDDGK